MKKGIIVDYLEIFIKAILAGLCISIAAIAFLSCDNKVVGSLFFTVGLFIILIFGFNLFTGKVCYVLTNKLDYTLKVVVIYIGNFVGTFLSSLLLSCTRLSSLQEKCAQIANVKINDNLFSLFILGILCNIMIYIAVEGFKSPDLITKYVSLFFGVSVFVLCGFEHSIADMFYFSFAKLINGQSLLCLLVITMGNIVGGVLFEIVKLLFNKKKEN